MYVTIKKKPTFLYFAFEFTFFEYWTGNDKDGG